jgi:hypothetical protein
VRGQGLHLELSLQAESQAVGRKVRGGADPATIGYQLPRGGLVQECPVEEPGHPTLEGRVGDGHHHLHPAVEVPLHEVGGAHGHPDRSPGRSPEAEHPGMFEVPAHDGPDPDPVGQPGNSGPEAAPAPDHQVHRDPGL